MKRDKLPGLAGHVVTLRPVAIRLDRLKRTQPEIDDEWFVTQAGGDFVEIHNGRTGHVLNLAPDHIHHFTTGVVGQTPPRAVLQLVVQYYIHGAAAWFELTRPGEPVPHPQPETVEMAVDLRYPEYAGLTEWAEQNNLRLGWCRESLRARRLHEGAEVFEWLNDDGRIHRFVVADPRERLILISTRA